MDFESLFCGLGLGTIPAGLTLHRPEDEPSILKSFDRHFAIPVKHDSHRAGTFAT